MTPVHLHLMINHVPVIGSAFATLLLIYALIRRKEDVRKAALGAFVVVALVTAAVFFSGDNSVDTVQKIAGVTKDAIHEHDEAAEGAFATMVALGVLALAQLASYRFGISNKLRSLAAMGTLVLAVIAFGWVGYASNLGGKIRHVEELGVTP